MNRTKASRRGRNGFTLIEVLVTLVIVAFVGILVVNFVGRKVTDSAFPLVWVSRETDIERQMEQVVSDYVREMNTNPDPATVLGLIVTRNAAGQYGTGVSMSYVEFVGNVETNSTTGPTDQLHVTVSSGGQTLMTILTKSRSGTVDAVINF